MNPSKVFISRPVATTLLTLGVALAGMLAFTLLPVSPLPQIDQPTISVSANMAGASPETMASAVATPLERHLGEIADVTEMTSSSQLGSTHITLQFGMNRDIDGAARDVQAAINAARADLPVSLKANPTYRKANPADRPILMFALTSSTLTGGQLYDAGATVLQQKISQVKGVGEVDLWGSSLPAVRVELNPRALFHYGISPETVRAALGAANANTPKGAIEEAGDHFQIYCNDQARLADQYRSLIVAYRDQAPVRLSDVATVSDSVEDLRNAGVANGQPAVLVVIIREPGANILETVDTLKHMLPELRASIPPSVDVNVVMDRSTTIRASLHEVERTLMISICLVGLVVFIFLRDWRASLIPFVAVPVSLIGTFGAMYLLGYSLDNLSLMSLTIATGFVVDDAIVVLENTMRHVEAGEERTSAALRGAQEVGFTVISMSCSLIAVFIPILLMGPPIGRMFREFAVTLSVAIIISLAVSLATTPMLCSQLLRHIPHERRSLWFSLSETAFNTVRQFYGWTLSAALRQPLLVLLSLIATIGMNVYLFKNINKGFFPEQDTGLMFGGINADQSTSFQLMSQKLQAFIKIERSDPAVENVVGFTGGRGTSSGFTFISLKPLKERKVSAQEIIKRLRPQLAQVPGASTWMAAGQEIAFGGRSSNSTYQFTLQADDLVQLRTWATKLRDALIAVPEVEDVNYDQQDHGLETDLIIDRYSAARLGLNASEIDNTLYDAFGQRQVSTIFNPLNQYHVVMEVDPAFWQSPDTLNDLYVSTTGGSANGTQLTNAVAGTVASTASTASTAGSRGSAAAGVSEDAARNAALNALANTTHSATSTAAAVSTVLQPMIPLSAFSHFGPANIPLSVNHQDLFAATTISFNLPIGESLEVATKAIRRTMDEIHVPRSIHGSFAGTAKAFQQTQSNVLVLILAAIVAIYIVLGILYESYIHPITILTTLPSAGVGALLALMLFKADFSMIALIGVFLLIGLVKKNAIMMIDVALELSRQEGLPPTRAIYEACLRRFRPIMMTTMVAMLGAVPLAIGYGEGSELRRPLGISIVGGLAVSQILTLYTTPVVYLYLDRLRRSFGKASLVAAGRMPAGPAPKPHG